MTPRKMMLRLAALVVMALPIVGPTPGYVGNCSGSAATPVNPTQFCTDKNTYVCARDLAAGRIDMTQYNVCSMHIDSMCLGFNWPDGCSPSKQLADACIDAVSDGNRIATTTDMLTECSQTTLCGAAPLTSGGI